MEPRDQQNDQMGLALQEVDSPYGEISEDGIVALADEVFVMYDEEVKT